MKHHKPQKAAIVLVALLFAVVAAAFIWQSEHKPASPVTEENATSSDMLLGEAHAAEAYYTCPMHPTIVQDAPGQCPICGMDLVKKTHESDEAVNPAAHDHAGHDQAADGGQTLYTCGMHPNVISEEAGQCPICGMDLTPVKNTSQAQSPSADTKQAGKTISIDPVVVQNMGVRSAHVTREGLTRSVRTIGEVDVAEDEISVVNLRFSGWVEKLWADETGREVKKGQWLFSIYSPELVSAQKEYLLAHNTSGPDSELTRSAAKRLQLWNIPKHVLARIIKEQNVERDFVVTAPRSGYILQKTIVEGARINAGQDLYRIGNLQKIWVTAEVYEFDAPWIAVGQPASMELSFQKGKRYEGKVGYIYPTLNPKSRTLKVRLEFENPGVALKPGMFATVRIQAERKQDVLTIPTEAVIHTGARTLVFVVRGYGKYSPREIVTGLTGDNHRTEVLEGLDEGEAVVTSGQFLLDSESQLQEAVQKLLEARLQARQKSKPAEPSASPTAPTNEGEIYWTCPMHPQIVQDGPGQCPICGMDLVKKQRGDSGQ